MSQPSDDLRRLLVLAVLAWATALPAPASAVVADGPVVPVTSVFPIVGDHTYGDGFGAGRGHKGQDVFAACGTPLVAARAGTVRFVGFEGAAGHYLVLATDGRGGDLVYMHLRDAPSVRVGEQVEVGRRVGSVGQTGDAWGCHLHFERWTAPGWYRGGRAIDPRPALRRWDA